MERTLQRSLARPRVILQGDVPVRPENVVDVSAVKHEQSSKQGKIRTCKPRTLQAGPR